MNMGQASRPGLGKFGKLPAKQDARTLRFETYADRAILHTPPAARDWTTGTGEYDADPLGNWDVGDCTVAAIGHAITLACKLAGRPSPITAAGVLEVYSAISGYDPARPETDTGAYLLDALKYVRTNGLCGIKIEAFFAVSPEGQDAALALCPCFVAGYSMPSSISGQDIWDDVGEPGNAGGHAIQLHAVSPLLDVGDTWGFRKAMHRRFRTRYQDERYAFLLDGFPPPPSGLNLDQLRADLALL